jgi:hypothetical protein
LALFPTTLVPLVMLLLLRTFWEMLLWYDVVLLVMVVVVWWDWMDICGQIQADPRAGRLRYHRNSSTILPKKRWA